MSSNRFVDVLLIVRDLIKDIEKKGTLSYPIPLVSGIIPCIEGKITADSKFPVLLSRRDWKSDQLYSALFRYENEAKIIYSAELNRCWRRFSICKEVSHLLIDDEKCHYTMDVISLVQQLITNAPVIEAESPIESEWMGIVAAVELLLPWKLRDQLTAMSINGKSDFEIAEFARVPEKFVNLVLRSPYGKTSAKINQRLDN